MKQVEGFNKHNISHRGTQQLFSPCQWRAHQGSIALIRTIELKYSKLVTYLRMLSS